jgi:hypothetical protein
MPGVPLRSRTYSRPNVAAFHFSPKHSVKLPPVQRLRLFSFHRNSAIVQSARGGLLKRSSDVFRTVASRLTFSSFNALIAYIFHGHESLSEM